MCLEFRNVWAASCFRGAHTPSTTIVDLHERLQNHKLWIDRINQNPTCKGSFKGLVLTGWARFSHESVLCELLPMSIPALSMCLSVVENQGLSLNMLHKELIGTLNLKGRDLLGSISEIFNRLSLKDFIKHTLTIDLKRPKILCQDSFDLCWILAKAHFLYKMLKSNIKNNQLLDYDKILS